MIEQFSNEDISTKEDSNYQQINETELSMIQPDPSTKSEQRQFYKSKFKLQGQLRVSLTNSLLTMIPEVFLDDQVSAIQALRRYGIDPNWKEHIEVITYQLSFVHDSLTPTIRSPNIEDKVHKAIAQYFAQLFTLDVWRVMNFNEAKEIRLELTYQLKKLIKGKNQSQCLQIIEEYLKQSLREVQEEKKLKQLIQLLSFGKEEQREQVSEQPIMKPSLILEQSQGQFTFRQNESPKFVKVSNDFYIDRRAHQKKGKRQSREKSEKKNR